MIKVKKLHPFAKLPTRSFHSAGYDLYASETTDCPAGKVRATVSALAGGAALGFGFGEIAGDERRLLP